MRLIFDKMWWVKYCKTRKFAFCIISLFSFDLSEVYGGVDWTELSGKLNPSFDWEGEIQDVTGLDISLHKVYRCINNSLHLAQKHAARAYLEENCELWETDKGQGQISELIIHQIFSLARDWSKRVTWPNIPPAKTGGYPRLLFNKL